MPDPTTYTLFRPLYEFLMSDRANDLPEEMVDHIVREYSKTADDEWHAISLVYMVYHSRILHFRDSLVDAVFTTVHEARAYVRQRLDPHHFRFFIVGTRGGAVSCDLARWDVDPPDADFVEMWFLNEQGQVESSEHVRGWNTYAREDSMRLAQHVQR